MLTFIIIFFIACNIKVFNRFPYNFFLPLPPPKKKNGSHCEAYLHCTKKCVTPSLLL